MPPVRSTASTDAGDVNARKKNTATVTAQTANAPMNALLPNSTNFTFGACLKMLSILNGFIDSAFVV